MIVFMLVVYGTAVIRNIMPLTKKENFTASTILVCCCYIVAYIVLLNHFVSLKEF